MVTKDTIQFKTHTEKGFLSYDSYDSVDSLSRMLAVDDVYRGDELGDGGTKKLRFLRNFGGVI